MIQSDVKSFSSDNNSWVLKYKYMIIGLWCRSLIISVEKTVLVLFYHCISPLVINLSVLEIVKYIDNWLSYYLGSLCRACYVSKSTDNDFWVLKYEYSVSYAVAITTVVLLYNERLL
jgi:hypothetical protein